MAYTRRFLTNYFVLVAGDLGSRIMAFYAMVHIARVLGKDLFGILGFAAAFTAYFEIIARQGLDLWGIQEVAREPSAAKHHADTLIGLRLATSTIAFGLMSLIAWQLLKPIELKMLVILSGLMFFTAAVSPQWVFQAKEEMKFAAAARILSTLIFAILVLSLLGSAGQILYVPIFQFCSEAVAVIWLLLVFARRYGFPRPSFDFRTWGQILRLSVQTAVEGVFGVLLFNFDMLMLGFWRPAHEVGEYSAAYKFINFFSSFAFLYGATLLPLIARNRGNPAVLRQVSGTSLKYTLLLVMPFAAGGTFLARDTMDLIFGSQFAASAGALAILIWVIPMVACRVVFRNTLLSHGLQRDLLWCAGCAAAINACLNLILIPGYSYIGSAAAMVITEAVLLLLVHRQVARKVVRISLLAGFWRPALACIPMVMLLSWSGSASLVTRIAAGAFVYIAAAWIVGAYSLSEIRAAIKLQAGRPEKSSPAP